jgi:hypothetical protein
VIDDSAKNLAELPTVKLGRLPITLNEAALKRDELLYERLGQIKIQRRGESGDKSGFVNKRHR